MYAEIHGSQRMASNVFLSYSPPYLFVMGSLAELTELTHLATKPRESSVSASPALGSQEPVAAPSSPRRCWEFLCS